jgi:hypothetical protein
MLCLEQNNCHEGRPGRGGGLSSPPRTLGAWNDRSYARRTTSSISASTWACGARRVRDRNADVHAGFPLGGKAVALVTAADRTTNRLAIYRVDRSSRRLVDVAARIVVGFNAYGSRMYQSSQTARFYVFVNRKHEGAPGVRSSSGRSSTMAAAESTPARGGALSSDHRPRAASPATIGATPTSGRRPRRFGGTG